MNELKLGDLVVQVFTDLSNLNKGLKDAEKQVQNTAGKITDLTNKIGKTLTVTGAAITGTFALMTKSVLDYNEQIYRLSEQTGISTEALNRFKYVADQNESSIEAVATGLKFLSRNMYEAASGSQQAQNKFNSMGISFANVDGSLRKAEDVLFDVADKFKGMSNETEKSALSMELFGRQGTALIPILNMGSDGIRKAAEEADRLGGTLGEVKSKALDTLGDSLRDIHMAMNGLWTEIVKLMAPALTELAKAVTNMIVKIREFAEAHPELTKNITAAVLAFGAFALAMGPIILMLTSLASNIAIVTIAAGGLGPILIGIFATLKVASGLGAAAFGGWGIGRLIGEVGGLDKVLTDVFTRMAIWLDNTTPKMRKFVEYMSLAAMGPVGWMAFKTLSPEEAKPTPVITPGALPAETPAPGETEESFALRVARIQELTEISKSFYDGEIQLRQMDLEDVVRELDALRANEEYSYEQRQAYATAYYDYQKQLHIQNANAMFQAYVRFSTSVESALSTGFANMIKGTQSFGEAIKSIWMGITNAIIDMISQMIAKWILFGSITGAADTATGGIFGMVKGMLGFETGGMVSASGNKALIPSAANGLFIEGPPGPMPVLIHPPEVIAPLDKFKEMIGAGSGGINIQFYNYGDLANEVDIEDLITRIGQRVKDAVRGS